VFIVADESPSEPDWDGQGHIFQTSGASHSTAWHTITKHVDYSRDDEAYNLQDAINSALYRAYMRGLDEMTFVRRYLTAFHDVVSFDWIDWDRDRLVAVVTRGLALAWGLEDGQFGLIHESTAATLQSWTQYGEGDVWGYVVERRAHRVVTIDDETVEDNDAWIDGEDSCWGYYGRQDAEDAASEAFSYYAKSDES
jgi:hypothetical protein